MCVTICPLVKQWVFRPGQNINAKAPPRGPEAPDEILNVVKTPCPVLTFAIPVKTNCTCIDIDQWPSFEFWRQNPALLSLATFDTIVYSYVDFQCRSWAMANGIGLSPINDVLLAILVSTFTTPCLASHVGPSWMERPSDASPYTSAVGDQRS